MNFEQWLVMIGFVSSVGAMLAWFYVLTLILITELRK